MTHGEEGGVVLHGVGHVLPRLLHDLPTQLLTERRQSLVHLPGHRARHLISPLVSVPEIHDKNKTRKLSNNGLILRTLIGGQ